jgi:outer membrane protein assembly factor BamA
MIFYLLVLFQIAFANTLDLSELDTSITKDLAENHKDLLAPPLNKAKIDGILRVVYATKKYRTVRAVSEAVDDRVIFKILTETIPEISKIVYEGKLIFSESTLSNIVQIQEGESYDAYKVRAAIDRLKDHYRKNAYLSVEITTQLSFSGEERVVKFVIDPKVQSKIAKIFFSTRNKKLKTKLQSIARDFENDPFTEQNILDLQNEIKEYLVDKRYYSTRLSDPNYEYLEKEQRVNISYKTSEEYQFDLIFSGNKKMSSGKLMKALNFEEGNYLGVNPASDVRERLKDYYKKNAFANVQIDTEQDYNKSTYTYRIMLKINEGKAIKIKSFTFDGATSFSTEFYTNFIKENSGRF